MIHLGDNLQILRSMETDSVDLVFTSPPYEDARSYDIDFSLKDDQWVHWAVERYLECARVSRGLVAWVVEGKTKNFAWSATPVRMMNRLIDHGIKLRKPPIFHRHGIPGSGGPDWLRNDYEFIVCSSKGKLPWSEKDAMGKPTKYDEGGACTNRTKSGKRVGKTDRGEVKRIGKHAAEKAAGRKYAKPKSGIANPGNVIRCNVGRGHMGSLLAHQNEAPFPESLAEFFVRSFCPPGGTVLDPFCGSGTTLAVAKKFDRLSIGIDLRKSQVELSNQRLKKAEGIR